MRLKLLYLFYSDFTGLMVGLTDELKDQMSEAASQTNKAYLAVRKGREINTADRSSSYNDESSKTTTTGRVMAHEVACMEPILRFLQLLCENHNSDLQVRDLRGFFISSLVFSTCFPLSTSNDLTTTATNNKNNFFRNAHFLLFSKAPLGGLEYPISSTSFHIISLSPEYFLPFIPKFHTKISRKPFYFVQNHLVSL